MMTRGDGVVTKLPSGSSNLQNDGPTGHPSRSYSEILAHFVKRPQKHLTISFAKLTTA